MVMVYERGSWKQLKQMKLSKSVSKVAFSAGDRYLGALCSGGPVYLYETGNWNASPRMVSGFDGRDRLLTMAFHPVEDLLAIGTEKDAYLCDIVTGKKKGVFFAGEWIFNMARSNDGKMLLTENGDERAGIPVSVPTVFDLFSQELLFTIPGIPLHSEPQFSYDDQLIGALDFNDLILFSLSRDTLIQRAENAVMSRPMTADEKRRYLGEAGLNSSFPVHAFFFIPPEQRLETLGYLSLFFLCAVILVALAGRPLTFRDTLGIEMPFSSERAQMIIESWNKDLRAQAADRQTKADFIMLLVYPVVLSLACVILSETSYGWMQTAGIIFSWLVLLCIPLDALENVMILKMLDGATDKPIPQITTAAAIIKFMLVIMALLYILIKVFPYIQSQQIG